MLDDPSRNKARDAWSDKDNLTELQVEVLDRLVAATVTVAVAWLAQIGLSDTMPQAGTVALPLLLAVFTLVAYRVCHARRLRLGGAIYVGGVVALIILATYLYATPFLLMFLPLAVGVASILLGAPMGFGAAGLIAVALVALDALNLPAAAPGDVMRPTILYSFAMALLLWVALYPLRTTLDWSWRSYERERDQMEAARTSRGELSRVLVSLDLAYRKLEAMNSELERARKAAVEARTLKAEFAANISHELRTPLNLIIGFSEMMIMSPHSYDDQPLPAAYRSDLQSIHRNAKHLSQLIDDVLDLSQVEAARMGIVREPSVLAVVVEEAMAAVRQIYKSKRLSLVSSVPEGLPLLEIDRTRIRQVLINLLNNAGRFTDEGGVTISAEVKDDEVVVCVADTGIGISEEDLAKTFEEFRQLDGSIRRKAGGSGLGLAISRKLIQLHGGRMWATSKIGEGTSFYFSLPLREEIPVSPIRRGWEVAPHIGQPLEHEESVVVVAPDERTAGLFRRYLDGYRVLTAATVPDALQLSEAERARALINTVSSADAAWPGARGLSDGQSRVPVLSVALHGTTLEANAAMVTRYLTKPVLQDQLQAVLAELGEGVRNLLIVDDDPDTVRLLSRMARLSSARYRITHAYDGEQALASMNKRRPDAVILDLLMPGVDGYTVLERMQASARLADVPVVVATARGREQETITADALGITRSDGFSVGEVMRCIKATIDSL